MHSASPNDLTTKDTRIYRCCEKIPMDSCILCFTHPLFYAFKQEGASSSFSLDHGHPRGSGKTENKTLLRQKGFFRFGRNKIDVTTALFSPMLYQGTTKATIVLTMVAQSTKLAP